MKKLIISALILIPFLGFSQKVMTKRVATIQGNEYIVTQVAKSKDEITKSWTNTGKIYKYEGTAYDVYVTASGKSFYILLQTKEGYVKKKIA